MMRCVCCVFGMCVVCLSGMVYVHGVWCDVYGTCVVCGVICVWYDVCMQCAWGGVCVVCDVYGV